MNAMRTILLVLAMLTMPLAMAAETGTALKAETMRAEPFGDAKPLGALAAGDFTSAHQRLARGAGKGMPAAALRASASTKPNGRSRGGGGR